MQLNQNQFGFYQLKIQKPGTKCYLYWVSADSVKNLELKNIIFNLCNNAQGCYFWPNQKDIWIRIE